jgi:hypothetical protein
MMKLCIVSNLLFLETTLEIVHGTALNGIWKEFFLRVMHLEGITPLKTNTLNFSTKQPRSPKIPPFPAAYLRPTGAHPIGDLASAPKSKARHNSAPSIVLAPSRSRAVSSRRARSSVSLL